MSQYKKIIFIFSFLTISILVIVLIQSYRSSIISETVNTEPAISQELIDQGKQLSAIYCTSCHIYPEPELLTKSVWRSQTLPAMGPKMGIYQHRGVEYRYSREPHVPENYYPSDPQLSSDEWDKIIAYYVHEAPEYFPPSVRNPEITIDSLFFKPHIPDYRTDSPPASTIARFDPGNQLLYLSDIEGTNLLIFNRQLELENSLFLSATLSDVHILNNPDEAGRRDLVLTYLGSLVPSDVPEGFIVRTAYDPTPGNTSGGFIDVILEDLVRPVETIHADLNRDSYNDLLISEFGHRSGSLFWISGNERGEFNHEPNLLMDEPGCIQSYAIDYNGNGFQDVIALCTQLNQQIYLFENSGNGEFSRSTLLQFRVTAGSSSFELADFNKDGHLDILYTSGDNADFSIAFKPYHGVYIYLNDGDNNFSKEWFYPVNGAYDAKARDFNGNGNLDIAVISFFGDYVNHPEEGFLFFKNDAEDSLSFTPFHHPATAAGRWIAMDVADWTGNGFDDILLSNYSIGPDMNREQAQMDEVFTQGPLFLLLENISE
ncbi:MAG: VCBS repeat-containing protein [Balneolaceae bacterium]